MREAGRDRDYIRRKRAREEVSKKKTWCNKIEKRQDDITERDSLKRLLHALCYYSS
jgi:hypothetical protein